MAEIGHCKNWSRWRNFPDPRSDGYLCAPFGPGVYELRNGRTKELVLVGHSKNVAQRMSSLLPEPYGCGIRKNKDKRQYVFDNLNEIDYRTKACSDGEAAKREERSLLRSNDYLFPT